MERLRLRVKDIGFGQQIILVRQGKGDKDRVTILPGITVPTLQPQLRWAKYFMSMIYPLFMDPSSYPSHYLENIPVHVGSGFGSRSFRQANSLGIHLTSKAVDIISMRAIYKEQSKKLCKKQEYPNEQLATASATHLPLTYLKRATTFVLSKNYSGIMT